VFTGTSEAVRRQLARGGIVASEVVRFEPDLDRGLQRCEEGLLRDEAVQVPEPDGDGLAGMPSGLRAHLEHMELPDGTVLIHQGESPDDVFVLASGRLRVETLTERGTRMRLRTLRPGVVVGEVAMYSGLPRTADVVAETPSVVLKLSKDSIERMETEDPELAAALHRWLATTLAGRLGESLKAFDALFD
jgi:SulP family sulfate permease